MAEFTPEMRAILKDFMLKSKCTQEELAHQIGVTLASLNTWLTGKRTNMFPSTHKLVNLFINEIRTSPKK
jgi:transcriptional regulator with XRE-family HTH domain